MSSLNYSQFIWNVADVLRGTYKQHQYGQIILPFTVLFRLDATLAPTKDKVLKAAAGYELDGAPTAMLQARAKYKYSFFNLSRHDLSTIASNSDTLALNLRDYVNRFSENARDIFEKYKFEDTIADLKQMTCSTRSCCTSLRRTCNPARLAMSRWATSLRSLSVSSRRHLMKYNFI